MKNRRWQAVAIMALGLTLSACGDDPADTGTTREVRMLASSFSPAAVTISVGGTVRWVNDQPIAHNITPANPQQPGAFTTQQVPATTGFAVAQRFQTAGVFNYSCTIHLGMTGSITVN